MVELISKEKVKPRLTYNADDFDLSESEFNDALDDIISEEGDWIKSYTNRDFAEYQTPQEVTDEFPLVRKAMVRLVRNGITQIREDGLTSESLGSGASGSGGTYDYRTPTAIQDEVKDDLAPVVVLNEDEADTSTHFRSDLI